MAGAGYMEAPVQVCACIIVHIYLLSLHLYIALFAEVDLIAKINREQELWPEYTCPLYSALLGFMDWFCSTVCVKFSDALGSVWPA